MSTETITVKLSSSTEYPRPVDPKITIDPAFGVPYSHRGFKVKSHNTNLNVSTHDYGGEVRYEGRMDDNGSITLTKYRTPSGTSTYRTYETITVLEREFESAEHARNVREWESSFLSKKTKRKDKQYFINQIAYSFGIDFGVNDFDLKEYSYAINAIKETRPTNNGALWTFGIIFSICLLAIIILLVIKDYSIETFKYNPKEPGDEAYQLSLTKGSYNQLIYSILPFISIAFILFAYNLIKLIIYIVKSKKALNILANITTLSTGTFSQLSKIVFEEYEFYKAYTISKRNLVWGIIIFVFGLFFLPALINIKGTPAFYLELKIMFITLGIGAALVGLYFLRKALLKRKVEKLKEMSDSYKNINLYR